MEQTAVTLSDNEAGRILKSLHSQDSNLPSGLLCPDLFRELQNLLSLLLHGCCILLLLALGGVTSV